tara:strand:+ start:812 stop:1678 length:867 start_codon:yes stop_codon:yes gene_type:complete
MRLIFSLLFSIAIQLQGMGTQMLNLPSSADELSMGSHATLGGLFPINPALYLANEKHPYLSLNRGNWIGDVSLSQIGYNKIGLDKVFHVGLKYSGLTDLEFRGDAPQDEAPSNFSAYGLVLDAGIGFKRLNQNYGISISYVQFGLYTEQSKGVSIDLGYSIKLKNGYSIGLVAKNLGSMTKLENNSPSLPKRFCSGISKEFQFKNFKNSIFGSIEWNSLVSEAKVHLGNRFRWNRLNLLAGYSTSNQVVESSVGIGINFDRYQVIYGTRFGSQDLGFPKLLSIRVLMP